MRIFTRQRPEWTKGLDEDDSLIPGRDEARKIASDWAKNRKARQVLNTQLVELGHDAMDILSKLITGVLKLMGLIFKLIRLIDGSPRTNSAATRY